MIAKIFDFIVTTLAYIIYPPICPVCGEIADERKQICEDCAKKICRLDEVKKFLPESLSGVFIITKYTGGTRDILRKLKFESDLKVLPTIAGILHTVSESTELKNFLAGIDFATSVPLHQERFQERGFNQTELIFADFLAEKNLPLQNFLVRSRATEHLYSYNQTERQKILQDAFTAVEGINLRGKKILLVDDIYTTGATTAECAKVLKSCGAEKIFVLAFASNSGMEEK